MTESDILAQKKIALSEQTKTLQSASSYMGPLLRRISRRQPAAIDLEDYPVQVVEKFRFFDTDLHGHVSSPALVACLQNARHEAARDQKILPAAADLVVVRMDITFKREVRWPGEVTIGTRVDTIGRSSVNIGQALFDGDRCLLNAQSTCVLIDRGTRRSTPWPEDVLGRLHSIGSQTPPIWPDRFAALPARLRSLAGL